jgi:hypothetical protein
MWRLRTPAGDVHWTDRSRNVEHGLELLDKSPFLHRYVRTVELLEGVDTGTGDVRVEGVLLFQLAAVHRLVGPFDLDSDGRLALLANLDRLVVTLNRHTAWT